MSIRPLPFRFAAFACCLGFALASTPPAQAELITFAYEGVIDQTQGGALFDAFLGQTLRIEYTFESTLPDTFAQSDLGRFNDPTGLVTLTVGSNVYTSTGFGLAVNDGFGPEDLYRVGQDAALLGPAIGGVTIIGQTFFFQLTDSTETVFTSDALPLIQPDPADFDAHILGLSFFDNSGTGFPVGTLGASTVSIVPEPGTVALLGLGGLAMAFRRRHGV